MRHCAPVRNVIIKWWMKCRIMRSYFSIQKASFKTGIRARKKSNNIKKWKWWANISGYSIYLKIAWESCLRYYYNKLKCMAGRCTKDGECVRMEQNFGE